MILFAEYIAAFAHVLAFVLILIHLFLFMNIYNIQDQRRLGAIVVPNKEEVLLAAKKLSIVDANTSELSKEKTASLVDEELRKW